MKSAKNRLSKRIERETHMQASRKGQRLLEGQMVNGTGRQSDTEAEREIIICMHKDGERGRTTYMYICINIYMYSIHTCI